ncbi:MAG: 50S ribosomal protein L24 [Candidatus Hepatoplasma vulgare]|nr:MAG: 50S ribosomal protein L24 [Candidatus Hepatoplasma sp.]
MKIKKNDKVVVIAGKEKGKTGMVKEVISSKNMVIVEGVNMRKHHVKPTQQNPEGGLLEQEGPLDVSNVMINIGKSKKEVIATKISYKSEFNKNGKVVKKRYSKKTKEIL